MRKCIECTKYKIKLSDPHWRDTCLGCYKQKLLNNKRCNICKKLSINKESSKDICNSCYVKEFKKCDNEGCDRYIIGEENLWKDICGSCYVKKMNSDIEDMVHDAIPKVPMSELRIRPESPVGFAEDFSENEEFNQYLEENPKLKEFNDEIREIKQTGIIRSPKRSNRKTGISWADASIQE